MPIGQVEFVKSSPDHKSAPPPDKPEYAFVGRSNVGKSSLINALTNRKKLAKTSSTPGKTQLINHFLVDGAWYLVDLPGYGYAKTSKKQRRDFKTLLETYLQYRPNLMATFVLADINVPPQQLDLNLMAAMGEAGLPFILVMTKSDKLSSNKQQAALAAYRKALKNDWAELPPVLVTSAESKAGLDQLTAYIEEVNREIGFQLSH